MKSRALSTLGLWLMVGLVLAGFNYWHEAPLGGFLMLLVLTLLAQSELYNILQKAGATPRKGLGLALGAGLMIAVFFQKIQFTIPFAYLAIVWAALLISFLFRPTQMPQWVLRFSTLFGVLYIPLMLSFFLALTPFHATQGLEGLWKAVWIVAATKFTDVGGLVIGIPFGKHKIAPQVSPAKSLEGCIGGVIFSMAVAAGLAWAFQAAGVAFMNPGRAACLAIPLALLSVPSDLVESFLKRRADIKDSGQNIPGIGGALDLIDSLILVAPIGFLIFQP
jgi:phosphatidate cytidylyltransferase